MMDAAETTRRLDWALAHAEGGPERDTIRVQALVELGEQVRASNLLKLASLLDEDEARPLIEEARKIVLEPEPLPDTAAPAEE